MNTLLAQYLQLVDPSALALPDNVADPSIQASIAAHMFRDSPDRPLPPISYQTRVLKRILGRIEESAGPEDVRLSCTQYGHRHRVVDTNPPNRKSSNPS